MAESGPPNNFTRQQLIRYRDLLANFSRRNKELYFRPGKASSLSLSVYLPPKLGRKKESVPELQEGDTETDDGNTLDGDETAPDFQFSPFTMSSATSAQLLETQKLDLTDHFGLRERKNLGVDARLEKIRAADSRYQKEFGISGAWLLGPFLLWRDSTAHLPDDLLISPIFKLPVDIARTKQKRWELVIEEAGLRINPSLQLALSKRLGLSVADEFEGSTIAEAVNAFATKIATDSRSVSVISANGDLTRFPSAASGDQKSLPPSISTKVENAIEALCQSLRGGNSQRPPELPRLLGKVKLVRDEEGNITGRRQTSLDQDLPANERCYYESAEFNHFLVVDAFYIDHIIATRLPLFRDYEQVLEQLADHPIIAELLGEGPLPTGGEKAKLPRVLDSYKERENFFVVPTDSSQHGAINLSAKSSAIVIQGPPGTGKSQTIANLIANKIATGKKILFVAEKRAALDVVYTRLKQAGIDKQAVLIHSSEINKKELYASFLELADSKPKDEDKAGWERTAGRLDQVKAEIHQYYDTAILTLRDTGLVVSDVLALHASQNAAGETDDDVRLGRHFSSRIKGADLDELATELCQLQALIVSLGDYEKHPWIHKRQDLVVTADIKNDFESLCSAFGKLHEAIQVVELKARSTFKHLDLSAVSVEVARRSLSVDDGLFAKTVDGELASFLRELVGKGGQGSSQLEAGAPSVRVGSLKKDLLDLAAQLSAAWPHYRNFRPDADKGLMDEMSAYLKVPRGILAPLSQAYWRAKRICRGLMTDEGLKCLKFSSLDERPFKAFDSYRKAIVDLTALFSRTTLGAGAPPATESWDKIETFVQNRIDLLDRATKIFAVIADLERSGLSTQELLNGGANDDFARPIRETFLVAIERDALVSQVKSTLAKVSGYFEQVRAWDFENLNGTFEHLKLLKGSIADCEVIERVELICRTIGDRRGLSNFRSEVLPLFLRRSGDWGARAKKEIARLWYDEVRTTHLQIRGFDRKLFESSVSEFSRVEANHCEASRIAVNDEFARRWACKAPDQAALGLLKKESLKQRKILYPRQVMEKGALETMLRLKPCWMMSPLSVSQILPLVQGMFDVIVFDEASQVRVEDAIPAIFRASSLVVVGDPQQMPPTNFFLGAAAVDDDDEEEEEDDRAESILDLAARVYPAQMLEWHYRSRSEALIAFSNRAFYGGRLIAPPNATALGQDGGLRYVSVQDAFFTQKTGNPVESDRVISELAKILGENADQSIGIIAMGQSQRVCLEQALDRRMAKDPTFANAVKAAESRTEGDAHVGLFIKNLENVQGDERDIILISVGYAPAKPGKKLVLNFGPLSKSGGRRRLNVAITRARAKVVVFSSLSPDDIPSDEPAFVANPDAACFGRYLKYVRAVSEGRIPEAQAILGSFGVAGVLTKRKTSGFSRDVARRLRERGHEVSVEVGSSGFFIDVAVHHPRIPGNFILGIECDGAMFHSSAYARDRDKARESLLTSRGWRMIRTWGPDWSRSWQLEIERIEAKLADILKNSPAFPLEMSPTAVRSVVAKAETKLSSVDGKFRKVLASEVKVSPTGAKVRYLSKSRYKKAVECPTKLFYLGKPDSYADSTADDAFLKALARGGFQVGALAKVRFPDGIEIETLAHEEALERTRDLLDKMDSVTIFEAAIRYENLFIRVDILRKVGQTLQLIEVKSKSFDPTEENPFFDKTALKKNVHKLSADYASYLYDIAFQTYVCRLAYPGLTVSSFLMLPNKAARTTVDGLNQKFLLKDVGGRPVVVPQAGLNVADIGADILAKVNVDEIVHLIHEGKNAERKVEDRCQGLSYAEEIAYFAKMYADNQRVPSVPSAHCKHCEFRVDPKPGLKSGFDECWQIEQQVKPHEIGQPFVFDIWNFRGAQKLIDAGKIFMKQVSSDDLPAKAGEAGLSVSERQWLQVEKNQTGSTEPFIDANGLRAAFGSWKFPLHFIDFETTMVAVPFTKGRRPYEQVAFQFSHHIVYEDGRIEHADQYLNVKPGFFPNFEFVRMLKKSLETDQGTIFRYAAHENTVLCQIHEQLRSSSEPDADDLMAWIRTVTTSSAKSTESWDGERSMVDLCDLVKRYYYHPNTGGSNSIKKVLPAVMNDSERLKAKYAEPIYGSPDGIKSLNFQNWAWIEIASDGSVKDPYQRLPSVYRGLDRHQLDFLLGEDELADGGAAMTAYAMMQFTQMSVEERSAIATALLRYCELDTFAMVLLYQYWADLLGSEKTKSAA